MSNSDPNKPSGKRGPRHPKQKQRRKPAQPQSPKLNPSPDPRQTAEPVIETTLAKTFVAPREQLEPIESAASEAASPANFVANDPVGPAHALSISLRRLADAYGNYARKSCEQTTSFTARLNGARSLRDAMELQAEFAIQAYETFLADSVRICDIYRAFARQSFREIGQWPQLRIAVPKVPATSISASAAGPLRRGAECSTRRS